MKQRMEDNIWKRSIKLTKLLLRNEGGTIPTNIRKTKKYFKIII
jgi:hypothetical protein